MRRKVLHIVGNLDRGAVENWLVRMLRHARKKKIDVDWTFYCMHGSPGSLDDEVRRLGARIIYSPVPLDQKLEFIVALRKRLQSENYDVLHCHHDFVSAVYLLASAGIPIRRRVVHVHNVDENIPISGRFKQQLFRGPMRWVCMVLADRILGNSNHTLDTFLAGRSRRPGRDVVHHYGVDPALFINTACDRTRFRRELGLPDDALILLFAGRVVPEKNPVFVIDVLADLRLLEPRTVAIFAGAGALEKQVLRRARELEVENAVQMLGWRDDLPKIMACSDWFILPHPENPMEGFGLAIVEAQLAGMRMLLSKGIGDDPLLPTAVFRRLPLAGGPKLWAEAAMCLLRRPPPSHVSVLDALRDSPMDMDQALCCFLKIYE